MAKRCTDAKCKEFVEMVCECNKKTYHCFNHFVKHMKKVGEHIVDSNFMEFSQDQRSTILKSLDERCKSLVQVQFDLKKLCSKTIQLITSRCKKESEKLSEDLIYCKKMKTIIFERGEIDRDYYKSFIASRTKYVGISKDLNKLEQDVNLLFEKHFRFNYEPDNEDKYYSYIIENTLVKIDLDTLKKSKINIDYFFNNNNSCKLPDGTLFINSFQSKNCFILDPDLEKIKRLNDSPVMITYSALGFIDGFVYIVGPNNQVNEKYNVKNNFWSKIAQFPDYNCSSGGVIADKLCITSYLTPHVYFYDSKTDQYTCNLQCRQGYKLVGHGFILTSQCAYKIKNNNINQWETINYTYKQGGCDCMVSSYIFRRGKYLYFCNSDQKLFRFDIELFEYRIVNVA